MSSVSASLLIYFNDLKESLAPGPISPMGVDMVDISHHLSYLCFFIYEDNLAPITTTDNPQPKLMNADTAPAIINTKIGFNILLSFSGPYHYVSIIK